MLFRSLAVALEHERPEVRRRAIAVLGAIGTKAAVVLPRLKEAVQKESGDLRIAAASALWQIGGDAETAVPVLIELLKGEETASRAQAAQVLGTIGKKASAAVAELTAALADEDDTVFQAGRLALHRIDVQAMTQALIDVLKKRDPVTFRRA